MRSTPTGSSPHVNDRTEELIDYRGDGLEGENLWEACECAEDYKLGTEYRQVMETQEPTTFVTSGLRTESTARTSSISPS